MRSRFLRLRVIAEALAAAVASLALPALAFADTAPPPTTAGDSNNVLLAVVALGALAAIVLFNRPRRRKE